MLMALMAVPIIASVLMGRPDFAPASVVETSENYYNFLSSGKLDWKKLISESGLKVISLHSYLNSIEENPRLLRKKP